MDIRSFSRLPILGIIRGIKLEEVEPLLEAVIRSGLETIEITMNTANAPELLRKAAKLSGSKLTVGAGTVTDKKGLDLALDSGAAFIVMPVAVREVVEYCAKKEIPVFPGAFTPQEIYDAWKMGATMVKVFPAKFFGPEYFREIKAPFDDIKLLACSGVTPQNLLDYFACGADAVSFGASVFRREWLEKKDYQGIERVIKDYILSFKENVPR